MERSMDASVIIINCLNITVNTKNIQDEQKPNITIWSLLTSWKYNVSEIFKV